MRKIDYVANVFRKYVIYKLVFSQSKYLALALLFIMLMSSHAYADIYKWRNARGVMQYSDKPPIVSFTKATRSEIIDALQSKSVCTVPNILQDKINVASARTENNAFFSGITNSVTNSNRQSLGASASSNSISTIVGRYKGALKRRFTAGSAPNIANAVASSLSAGSVAATKSRASNTTLPTTVASNPTKVVLPTIPSVAPVAPAVASASPKTIVAQTTPSAPSASIKASNIVQVALMPAVDISKNVAPAAGFSDLRIQPTTEVAPIQGGAFRISCAVSHMSNDDPLVYPNQPGAAHHHTFFGNTTTNASSDLMTLSSTGNSTCNGGIMNRSAYWVPSMIDTSSNTPIKPDSILFYYKTGDFGAAPTAIITPPPRGLRMIAGNAKATTAQAAQGLYTCITAAGTTGWQPNIVNCAVGDTMQFHIDFPQCWDGKNLDSPDHKSHMSNRVNVPNLPAARPASHPVMIPAITLHLNYKITVANQTTHWRLSSDNYSTTSPGGYSTHADWVNGWDEKIMAGIVKNCLQKNADGHAHLLCDGRMFY